MRHEASSFKREQPLELPPGNLFTRTLTARVVAHIHRVGVEDVISRWWPNDKMLAHWLTIKATSTPAMTGVAGWAQELAQRLVADTMEALGQASSAVDVMSQSLNLSWNGLGSISAPGLVASAANGGFVAEGDPIPVRQLVVGPAILAPKKVASIAVLTREMLESGNAEALIGDTLVKSAALAIDAVFFGTAAATTAAPAGIRNGISATTPSNNTVMSEAFAEDFVALTNSVAAVGGKGPYVLAMSPGRAAAVVIRFSGAEAERNMTVVGSGAMGNDIAMIAPKALVCAVAPDPDIETASTGTLMMDTAPQVAGTTGQSERSLFQTDSIAIKIRWPVSWVLRDARGVAWATPTWK